MKILRITFLFFVAGSLVFFANCGGDNGGGGETNAEKLAKILTSKQWSLTSISLPPVNATEEADWDNFKVTFSSSTMTPTGHATGASVVWPDGGWSFTSGEEGILRAKDGVTMDINALNETTLNVTFTMPAGTELGSRVAALDGEYTFILE